MAIHTADGVDLFHCLKHLLETLTKEWEDNHKVDEQHLAASKRALARGLDYLETIRTCSECKFSEMDHSMIRDLLQFLQRINRWLSTNLYKFTVLSSDHKFELYFENFIERLVKYSGADVRPLQRKMIDSVKPKMRGVRLEPGELPFYTPYDSKMCSMCSDFCQQQPF